MNNKNVIVIAKTTSKPGYEEKTKAELLNLVEHTVKEDGCITYQLHISTNNPSEFMFYEVWTSKEALDKHAQSAHIQKYRSERDAFIIASEVTLWDEIS